MAYTYIQELVFKDSEWKNLKGKNVGFMYMCCVCVCVCVYTHRQTNVRITRGKTEELVSELNAPSYTNSDLWKA